MVSLALHLHRYSVVPRIGRASRRIPIAQGRAEADDRHLPHRRCGIIAPTRRRGRARAYAFARRNGRAWIQRTVTRAVTWVRVGGPGSVGALARTPGRQAL